MSNGIENVGNTCYLASVIQCIANCTRCLPALLGTEQARVNNDGGSARCSVTAALREMCRSMHSMHSMRDGREKRTGVDPRKLIAELRKRERMDYDVQNDAHEFLVELLTAVESESESDATLANGATLPANQTNQATAMQRLNAGMRAHWSSTVLSKGCRLTETLYGQNACLTQCPSCGHVSQSFDVFVAKHVSVRRPIAQSIADVNEYIEGFECERCSKRCTARRECKMSRPPPVLILQLMRFGAGWNKDTSLLDFGRFLDIGACSLNTSSSSYELKCILCHRGASQDGGHYYAVICKDGEWLLCDDEEVRAFNVRDLRGEDPYLLFYEMGVAMGVAPPSPRKHT